MKTLMSALALAFAVGSLANAQPAYDAAQGPAPSDYPPCAHKGQDRCMPAGHAAHRHGHHKDHKGKAGEKAKGERG